jgi:hypothetical protein
MVVHATTERKKTARLNSSGSNLLSRMERDLKNSNKGADQPDSSQYWEEGLYLLWVQANGAAPISSLSHACPESFLPRYSAFL